MTFWIQQLKCVSLYLTRSYYEGLCKLRVAGQCWYSAASCFALLEWSQAVQHCSRHCWRCSRFSSRLFSTARGSGLRLFRKLFSIGLPYSLTPSKYSNRSMDWSTTSSTSADCTPICFYALRNGFALILVWVYKLLGTFLHQTGWQL